MDKKFVMSHLLELSGLVWFAFPLIKPVSKLDGNTIFNTINSLPYHKNSFGYF